MEECFRVKVDSSLSHGVCRQGFRVKVVLGLQFIGVYRQGFRLNSAAVCLWPARRWDW